MEQLEVFFRCGFLNSTKDTDKSIVAMNEGSKG